MKILLTGATGYIGQAFLKEFGHKYSVRVLGRTSVQGSLEFIKGDMRAYADVLNAAAGVDVIVHLAAFAPDVKQGVRNEDFFDYNVKGTFNILQAAVDSKVKRVVYASSICAVGYEGLELPIKEDAKPNPSDGMYGFSKYLGEELCEYYSKWYGISALCLRTATVVPKHAIVFPPDPDTPNWYGYVDIRDVICAFDLAINAKGIKHGVFHINAENSVMKYDITGARKVLGFKPIHNNEEFLAKKTEEVFKQGFPGYMRRILLRITSRLRRSLA
jgi:nucleoside-diphosphate-sugar epimerase